jgi:hypothetical protein
MRLDTGKDAVHFCCPPKPIKRDPGAPILAKGSVGNLELKSCKMVYQRKE